MKTHDCGCPATSHFGCFCDLGLPYFADPFRGLPIKCRTPSGYRLFPHSLRLMQSPCAKKVFKGSQLQSKGSCGTQKKRPWRTKNAPLETKMVPPGPKCIKKEPCGVDWKDSGAKTQPKVIAKRCRPHLLKPLKPLKADGHKKGD